MHEDHGGNDKFGLRSQRDIEILLADMDALTFNNRTDEAKDDVSGSRPELVKIARAEEMDFFRRFGVYEGVHEAIKGRQGER